MANRYLPINVAVKYFPVLIVGGGKVALRKIENLIDFNVDITVIAPEISDKIEYHATKGRIKLEKRPYQSPEASKYGLVISAANDEDVNRQVYNDCHDNNILVNVVDNPALCTFIFPAMMKRDNLSVAISTDGKAPFLAAHLRLIMENLFPNHWSKIARLAADYRNKVHQRWGGEEFIQQRFAALDRFLQADWKQLIKIKSDDELQNELDQLLEEPPPEEEEEEPTAESGSSTNEKQ